MKTYDNHGKLSGEINTSYTRDGKVIISHTTYDTNTGHVAFQSVRVRDSQGKVTVENVIGGKPLP